MSRSGALTLSLFDSVHALPPRLWDQLATQRPFTSVAWLAFVADIMDDWSPRFLLWQRNGEPMAAAICYRQRRFHLSAHGALRMGQGVLRPLLRLLAPMTCGVPVFGSHSALLLSPQLDAWGFDTVVRDIEGLAWRSGAQWLGFDSLDSAMMAQLAPRYLRYFTHDEATLDLSPYTTYADYEQGLPKKKRSEIRRLRNRARDAGVTVAIGPIDRGLAPTVRRLISETAARHGNEFLYTNDFLTRATTHLPESSQRMLVVSKGGDAIGTVSLFKCGEHGLVKWIGLDYAQTEGSYAYHYLMTETVTAALALGITRLNLGGQAWALKKHMGADAVPRYAALRWRNAPVQRLVASFLIRPKRRGEAT
ncbi:MAG: GNAT family N-acetyltransferase [Anaerolineales bacterium]|nr:GNAT family N-acetyltransferase [Anaerolineales bacterium]MCB9126750.1 GNAT family N-acetyltransferase [Ardenticatenales bacterium]